MRDTAPDAGKRGEESRRESTMIVHCSAAYLSVLFGVWLIIGVANGLQGGTLSFGYLIEGLGLLPLVNYGLIWIPTLVLIWFLVSARRRMRRCGFAILTVLSTVAVAIPWLHVGFEWEPLFTLVGLTVQIIGGVVIATIARPARRAR